MIGKRIKEERERKGISRKKLSDLTGLTETHLWRIETGKVKQIGQDNLRKIADVLTTSVDYLQKGYVLPKGAWLPGEKTRKVPLIDWTQAGEFTGISDKYPYPGYAEEYIETEANGQRTFALRVKGDSMEPRFKEGDVLIINPDIEAVSGDFIVAKNDREEEATFKQLKRYGQTLILHPLNSKYEDIEMKKSMRIVGKVVEVKIKL